MYGRVLTMTMTKQEIISFVKRCAPHISVLFYSGKNHPKHAFGGYYINEGKTIYLNEDVIFEGNKRQTSKNYIQQLILHEIGHEQMDSKTSGKVERELEAQVWAINKAEELGMTELKVYAKWCLSHMWTLEGYGKLYPKECGWNSNYRKYYLANKLAKKRRII